MPIYAVDSRTRRTAVEDMRCTIQLKGETIVIPRVSIPATLVHKLGFLRWQVDPCVGYGNSGGNTLEVQLPPELVTWSLRHMTMVAREIVALGTLVLASGDVGKVVVTFPDCKTNVWSNPMLAEEVTAVGTVTFD